HLCSSFAGLKLLGHFLEVIALNDVANFVFSKISKLDPALDPGSHFFYVILETAQCSDTPVIDWLTPARNTGSTGSHNSPVQYETSRNDSLGKCENLSHLRVPDDALSNLRIKQSDHSLFHLIDQFVDDAVELDLNSFALCGRCGLVLHLDVETNDHGV